MKAVGEQEQAMEPTKAFLSTWGYLKSNRNVTIVCPERLWQFYEVSKSLDRFKQLLNCRRMLKHNSLFARIKGFQETLGLIGMALVWFFLPFLLAFTRPISPELNWAPLCDVTGNEEPLRFKPNGKSATMVVRLVARCCLFWLFIWNAHNSHSIQLNNISGFSVTALPLVERGETKRFWKQNLGHFPFTVFIFYGDSEFQYVKIT